MAEPTEDQAPPAAAPPAPAAPAAAAPPQDLVRRRVGRPSKLTVPVVQVLLEGIKHGLSYKLAVMRCGIDYSTFCRWVEKGEQQSTGEYREFCDRLELAQAEGAFANVLKIKAAAAKDWRAAAWLLEARHPDEYGRRRIEVTGKDGGPVEQAVEATVQGTVEHSGEVQHHHAFEPIDLTRLSDEQLDQIEQLLAQARTDGSIEAGAGHDGAAADPR